MSGWKPLLVALSLTAGSAASAGAQGVVPGGWSPVVGYQSFGVSSGGFVGVGFGLGYGFPGAGYSGFGPGGVSPAAAAAAMAPPVLQLTPSSQAVNGLVPLSGAIGQGVRRKGRR